MVRVENGDKSQEYADYEARSKKLDEFGATSRVIWALQRRTVATGIAYNTPEVLQQLSDWELMRIRNIGKESIKNIRRVVETWEAQKESNISEDFHPYSFFK